MCGIASLFLLQRLKGSMSGDVLFQQHRDASCHQGFLRARQGAKGNSCHSDRNIRGTCTIVFHCQNWVSQFKHSDFSTCDASYPG